MERAHDKHGGNFGVDGLARELGRPTAMAELKADLERPR
jgi:hypothetical protein